MAESIANQVPERPLTRLKCGNNKTQILRTKPSNDGPDIRFDPFVESHHSCAVALNNLDSVATMDGDRKLNSIDPANNKQISPEGDRS